MILNYINPIKVLISEKLYSNIKDDANRFKILKTNEEPNINKFINIVIRNYHEEYLEKEIKKINVIKKELFHIKNEFERNEVATKIYESILYMDDHKEEIRSKRYVSLKPNQESDLIIEHIKTNILTSSLTLTTFLRNMLSNFFKLPAFEREKIIFKDIYTKVNQAIKENLCIKLVTVEQANIISKPFCIDTNSEAIHNYIIGKEAFNDGKQFIIAPRRLGLIKKVTIDRKTKIEFTTNDRVIIEKMKKNGIQFFYQGKEQNITVGFTKKGFDLYKKMFLQKPDPIQPILIDNDKYILEFDCSYFQLQNFLYKFGKEAKIIKPIELANKMKNFYHQAYSNYNK